MSRRLLVCSREVRPLQRPRERRQHVHQAGHDVRNAQCDGPVRNREDGELRHLRFLPKQLQQPRDMQRGDLHVYHGLRRNCVQYVRYGLRGVSQLPAIDVQRSKLRGVWKLRNAKPHMQRRRLDRVVRMHRGRGLRPFGHPTLWSGGNPDLRQHLPVGDVQRRHLRRRLRRRACMHHGHLRRGHVQTRPRQRSLRHRQRLLLRRGQQPRGPVPGVHHPHRDHIVVRATGGGDLRSLQVVPGRSVQTVRSAGTGVLHGDGLQVCYRCHVQRIKPL